MELLSPAGGMPALHSAIDAGADAIYLGLKYLNARAGAANFTPEELKEACALAHSRGVRIYLTLNIDLAQRELGLAARCLTLARDAKVDAVLFRDPAILAFRPFFPELQFHFSTQAGISSSAGVAAAKALQISRVVLARELSLEEIRACCGIGPEIEVFGQGALCFSCSGRCLLSSWGGGRSGNRGACASPCRILWTTAAGNRDRFLSMHDLCSLEHLKTLQEMQVASLKIEGRLKAPAWVHKAVTLYRHAIDGTEPPSELRRQGDDLGNYTGRTLTDGYLRGIRTDLTGDSRRKAAAGSVVTTQEALPPPPEGIPGRRKIIPQFGKIPGAISPEQESSSPSPDAISECSCETSPLLHWEISQDEKEGILLTASLNGTTQVFRLPPRRIPNPKRAQSLGDALQALRENTPEALREALLPVIPHTLQERLLARSAVNGLLNEFSSWLRIALKEDDGMPRHLHLPEGISPLLNATKQTGTGNLKHLGDSPDTLALFWNQPVPVQLQNRHWFLRRHIFPMTQEEARQQITTACTLSPNTVIALPQILYEAQIPAIQAALLCCKEHNLTVEVNSWDTWHLAKEAGLPMIAGAGMAVLNGLAANELCKLGLQEMQISQEIDQNQLEALCQAAEVPLSLVLFAYPALMSTRAILPASAAGSPLQEARKTTLHPSQEGELTVLRPEIPMDWRKLQNRAVAAAHLILDLRGLPFSAKNLPPCPTEPFLFNYDRRLR